MRHTAFTEVMEGTIRLTGEREDRPIRLDLKADLPDVLKPWDDLEGTLQGRVRIKGWADTPVERGRLRVAPIAARRIRYTLDFTAEDGRRLHLDGWKSTTPRHPVRSMTRLPATVTDTDGTVVGQALLYFRIRRDLARFLAGFRFPRPAAEEELLESRWKGQQGRLEVWYTTLTDPATGTGFWVHHELVSPSDGGPVRAHGLAVLFPPGGPPVTDRFGPYGWSRPGYRAGDVRQSPGRLEGTAGKLSWNLTEDKGGAPLYTLPRWAWERELLPAAHVVTGPTSTYTGTIRYGEQVLELKNARGASARIYGHGNAKRWAWLHADLGGGDVCEVVAPVSTRPGLNRLPALPFVRLRVNGEDWPKGDPMRAALRMRADISLPTWEVRGRIGDRRIHIQVTQPPAETVTVDYADPDGSPVLCHNSERADALITLSRRTGKTWRTEREWRLTATAHAEVGTR